jgi:DNA-binding response OmpR family regulator
MREGDKMSQNCNSIVVKPQHATGTLPDDIPMRKRILIIDDEPDVVDLLKNTLQKEFTVAAAFDGPSGLRSIRERIPDAVILDVMLPGMNGFEICRAIQAEPSTRQIPVIILTARVEEVDRVVGFELGADDYVTKPFSPRELLLRLSAILRGRNAQQTLKEVLKLAGLVVDRPRHKVTLDGKAIELGALEFKLLSALIERPEVLL